MKGCPILGSPFVFVIAGKRVRFAGKQLYFAGKSQKIAGKHVHSAGNTQIIAGESHPHR